MATNPYYNNYNSTREQNLVEDLIVESVKLKGHDVVYLPRHINVQDKIMTEPTIQTFRMALDVEMYIKNWDSFQGEGQLLAKFGLEVRDQMTLQLTKRSFQQFIQPFTRHSRPQEGDCIYIPMLGVVYQLKYTDTSSPSFYTLGKNYAYDLVCEILEFNNEQFETGREEIDSLNPPFEHLSDPDYNLEDYNHTAQNSDIQEESDDIVDWSERNPFNSIT